MKFSRFIKEKWVFFLCQTSLCLFFCTILSILRVSSQIQLLVIASSIITGFVVLLAEYLPKKRFFDTVDQHLQHLKEKRLLCECISPPSFLEGQLFYDILTQTNKAMNDEIACYQSIQEEYHRYIETWIHEVKTPISAAEMLCKNHLGEFSTQIQQQLYQIDEFVEQALYYARSTNLEKDYIIRKHSLDTLIKNTVKRYAGQLISVHCTPSFENLDCMVYTDSKWLEFILGQIITNSIKYRKDPMKLRFIAQNQPQQTLLSIVDNGIGIPCQDIARVFEKGFTGKNGRNYKKSTGIGLYLCKILCEKMNLSVSIASTPQIGTIVTITFPKNHWISLE